MDEFERETAAVLRALRERDEKTSDHCGRTCALAVEMGKALGLPSADLATLKLGAALHDVGKIGIPDSVLLKPGRLDEDELCVMRTHPRRGHDILVAIPDVDIAAVAAIALRHHEFVDGGGYPDGLKGEEIPVPARIVAVVDCYDAIATVRPYHAAKTHAEVMRMLHEMRGRKLDPYVLDAFERVVELSPYRAGS